MTRGASGCALGHCHDPVQHDLHVAHRRVVTAELVVAVEHAAAGVAGPHRVGRIPQCQS